MRLHPKYKSRRFLVSIWALILSTTLMIMSMAGKYEPSWMAVSLPMLLGIILAWVGIESWGRTKQTPTPKEEAHE